MKQRKPMNRISAKRQKKLAEKPERVRAVAVPIPADIAARIRYSSAANSAPAQPKAGLVEHEGYRRLVAQLACMHCQRSEPIQAAHPNTDKGMSLKTDDRLCFPLCTVRLGVQGCHERFDQGAMFTKEERRRIEPVWGAHTRYLIRRQGLWPADLPAWPGDEKEAA